MPIYIYKAVTKNGQVVRNRVEEKNKFVLMRKIKENELMPISITQINVRKKRKVNARKRNIEGTSSALKQVREREIQKELQEKNKWINKLKVKLNKNSKIKIRDIVIFTQNFYLLKKANFNNIHALLTTIETTENPVFKEILEDILVGVESGENMYTTMEYYEGVFPPIYINMIKVGELSRFINKSFRRSDKIFR